MEGNDLSTYSEEMIIVILEGVLVAPKFVGKVRRKLAPADDWPWQILPLKRVTDMARLNVSVEIATFISQDVADAAADWLLKYDIPFSDVTYYDFNTFTQTLILRSNIRGVYDADPQRFMRYGQRGVACVYGEDFHG